ncbi:MAG: hypothetical protein KAJ07_03590 [Planctomycetes bacterium]|nr:hypothetical protein [Planctomycetota bacterium]
MSNTLGKKLFCLLAIIIVSVLSMPANVFAADNDRAPDQRDHGRQGPGDRMRTSKDILERIAKDNPEKAEQLRKLRDEDLDKFWAALNYKSMRKEMSGPRGPEQDRRGQSRGQERVEGERGRSKGRGGQWKERVQKQHDEFVEWLGKNYPNDAEKLEKLKDKDPGAYIKQVAEKRKKYGEIMEAEKKSPKYANVLKEDMKLRQTRDSLIRKLKNADADQKEELQAELKEAIAKRFDIVIKKKQFKYKALKQRLEKLQKQVTDRQAELDKLVNSKDKAIADRMKELVGQSEKLNWD